MKINETFLSVQGEGILTGLPTYFIRTSGCNLRCSYCDTKYAYMEGKDMTCSEILKIVRKQPFKRLCLTGGEPLLQDDSKELILRLIKEGYQLSIETNGSINLNKFPNSKLILYSVDYKCPSSKEEKSFDQHNFKFLTKKDQLKFIICNQKDYNFAKKVIKENELSLKTNVIISPVWGVNCKFIINSILKDKLDVRLGLQMHKMIFGNKRSV
ncbi:radical SAM protein [Candidatus Falkowbacteria bacterium]|nr:radical SAM protein [Candidatus Falkowbacteria bacterium]